MIHSCHFDKTELKIMIFTNFQVYHRKGKNFESSYGQMTNLNMIFYMVVSIYKSDQICNSPQSPARL